MKNKEAVWAQAAGVEIGIGIACCITRDLMLKAFSGYYDVKASAYRQALYALEKRRQIEEMKAKDLFKRTRADRKRKERK